MLYLRLMIVLSFFCNALPAQERTTIVVDQDGRGAFRTIGAAIESATLLKKPVTIFIRNGIYAEKLFIASSNLALVGEHRDSTRIVFAELRSNWTKARDNRTDGSSEELDWGAGVINIGKGAADVTIANLTVHNNYGSLHRSRDHQFTIRGFDATRIALLYCTVISDGGDAVALWNREDGMYYHSNCSFEGWVDYVCPRGWCYITDSKFFGHNMSASIWHDGSADRDQKFVIRNSSFDGVPGFPLGRHHRDAQIYLLDCTFSGNMADRPIYWPESPNAVTWVWGERHYFYNCRRDGGAYSWFADNLEDADGTPSESQITALWTFGGRWDPERSLPAVLPFAVMPSPRNDASIGSAGRVGFQWTGGRSAVEYRLYVGNEPDPPFHAVVRSNSYEMKSLRPSTQYHWRVDTVTETEVIPGEIWKFTTSQ
ncbi:MAG: pectinesterase family protein [Bacteroidota bacterium]